MFNLLLLSGGAIAGIIIGVVVLILVIVIISWYINTRNAFVRLKNKVEEAWSNIDISLKKRYDLIPNLVETVKGFASHESETLQKVIAARNIAAGASTAGEKIEADKQVSSSLRTLFNVVSEQYPTLQANTNFLDLQNQLKGIENELASARRYYNGVVKQFNTKIELFPDSIVSQGMGEDYKKKPLFTVDSAEERQNVKVQF